MQNKYEAVGIDDDDYDGTDLIDDRSMKQMDRQIRMTLNNCQRFGFTDGCPRCLDLETGAYRTNAHHNDNCRLNMYLAFRDANTAKWRTVRHVSEPEPDGKLHQSHVDPGGQRELIPQVLDGEDIFHSAPHEPNEDVEVANAEGVEIPVMDRDVEQTQADEAFAHIDDTGNDSDVAEMFKDDGYGADGGADAEDKNGDGTHYCRRNRR